MNKLDLDSHYLEMTADGYKLEHPDFLRLKSWHGVLFQIYSAANSLKALIRRKPTLGSSDDALFEQALFSNFVLQYSKCFTSSGTGQVKLDENQVFVKNSADLAAHKRIMEIRHNLAAHNGNIDLILASIAVREEEDCFLVRHFITIELPSNEFATFEQAIQAVDDFVIRRLNKHLDSLQEKLGKPILIQ